MPNYFLFGASGARRSRAYEDTKKRTSVLHGGALRRSSVAAGAARAPTLAALPCRVVTRGEGTRIEDPSHHKIVQGGDTCP